ncbi:uncharacterized protein BDFB_004767 [Asbolus verrucosus]|uniref:Uncharacterized protein n=1 Tax=Asbolus verrucosus TaxID=1661398 RepID=A0A482VF36_ASBVE|nr:uncharacterized protein BDFB_004767 [Asbolus verrucosus]
MATKQLILVILVIVNPSFEGTTDNRIEDVDPLDEAKAAIWKEQNAQNIGGMLNNLMQSDGAKQLGDMLVNAAGGESGKQILQGLGSILGQGQNLDPSVLGAAMSMFQAANSENGDEGLNPGTILSFLGNLMGQSGQNNFISYLPMFLQTMNAFFGPEAEERVRKHSSHSDMMPAFMEKIHILSDHFMNSEMGKQLINTIGAEKFVKIFSDDKGNFSYRKFVDMLENHSFRKHWISIVTNRIALVISHISDPKIQRKYLITFQHFLNSILKSQGYPKSALFDFNRPTETITNIINYMAKDMLKTKVDSKQYVKPAVEYIQELFNLGQKRGMLNVDHQQVSDKLADTINLEVIEPIARVNRAYRFARKVRECDKYVMCLVNQDPQDEKLSLPGLKPLLSRSASLILSWSLSSQTGTPFWTFYRLIMERGNCQEFFLDACNDFHAEEIKVTTEYVHNEL